MAEESARRRGLVEVALSRLPIGAYVAWIVVLLVDIPLLIYIWNPATAYRFVFLAVVLVLIAIVLIAEYHG
jgi:hypothetical protein